LQAGCLARNAGRGGKMILTISIAQSITREAEAVLLDLGHKLVASALAFAKGGLRHLDAAAQQSHGFPPAGWGISPSGFPQIGA
jgi:hypothetical protein